MLIRFRVSNFRSFEEEQTLSLVASKDTAHPDNLILGEPFTVVKTGGVFGANASGKSNLITAMRCMQSFVCQSATKMNQDDRIPGISPFRLATPSLGKPSAFEVMLTLDGIRYDYGFTADSERVHSEWLLAYPRRRAQRWIQRVSDPKLGSAKTILRGPLESQSDMLRKTTRDNGLILSRGAQLNIEALSKVYLWFRSGLNCLDLSADPDSLVDRSAWFFMKNPQLQEQASRLLRDADLGIAALRLSEQPLTVKGIPEAVLDEELFRKVRDALKDLMSDLAKDSKVTMPAIRTVHKRADSGEEVQFDFSDDESQGTQRFFGLLGPVMHALAKGNVLFLDELGCSMHPLLTRTFIELFQSREANATGAQMVFATHDVNLFDQELFRRDQLWLFEKNQRGASELFSLYDFGTHNGPRSTTAFQKQYLAGRYGGVPRFGATFEDLELK